MPKLLGINKTETHLVLNILGIKLKFKRTLSNKELYKKLKLLEAQVQNTFYELKDSGTLENIKIPKVINKDETLNTLVSGNKSLCRYGDGEFFIAANQHSIKFQKFDKRLSERLREILKSDDESIMVCIMDIYGALNQGTINFRDYLNRERTNTYAHLDFNKTYFDMLISRPFIGCSNLYPRKHFQDIFDKFKLVWKDKDIVIVEGEGTRAGIGNDLYDNCRSIKRILCPAKNAFDKYDEILAECKKYDKNTLFIAALGPTATVLAYDLAKDGYRALDIGHLDIEYEFFLRKEKDENVKSIPGKFVNEVAGNDKIFPCKDEKYLSQITAKIL